MTGRSKRYTDIIDLIETDTELRVSHRATPGDTLLDFKNIFSILSSVFKDSDTTSDEYYFGWRNTFKIYNSPSTTYIKNNHFTLMTKDDYLKPIGFFHSVIEASCPTPSSKVCILAASGLAFHTCLLSCNIAGSIPVLINSAQTDKAIYNALEETQPSIVLLDDKSASKLLLILQTEDIDKEALINSLVSVVFDETDAIYSGIDTEKMKTTEKELKEIIHKVNKEVKFHYFSIKNTMKPFKFPEQPIFNKEENDHVLTIYTSGSTAEIPKGVLITNRNLVAGICTIYQHVDNFEAIRKVQPRYLSYLPLSHIFELLISYNVMLRNGLYAFGNPKTLTGKNTINLNKEPDGDFKSFKPNFMCAVPLVLSRIKAAAEDKIQSKGTMVKFLYNVLLRVKEYKVPILSFLGNQIFFNQIKEELGGDVLAIISGGAFLCDNLKQWTINVLDVNFCEGYALTETCAIGLYSLPNIKETKKTYVGIPTKQNKAIILKTDEFYKETRHKNRRVIRGSLLLEGESITERYVNGNPVKENGNRIVTGDIAEIQLPLSSKLPFADTTTTTDNIGTHEELELGAFKIVGREKENIKLSNGEFYNLVHYENIYRELKGVKQCMVYINEGNNNEITLVLNTENEIEPAEIKELENKKGIHKSIIAKKVVVIKEEWNLENGCLTPTLKLKRFKILEKYKVEIENGFISF